MTACTSNRTWSQDHGARVRARSKEQGQERGQERRSPTSSLSNMRVLTTLVVLATLSTATFAKVITIKNQHFGGNDKIHYGNHDCGQDVYHFDNISCDGNAKVHLGDDVPKGCKPPNHTYGKIKAAGKCKMHMGHTFL
ncbi:hypothetical protein B0H63DRAFT_528830 [Podospora didyma]|uniref:Uncharacterized protein n=1 Tax=Podospora didyma TaxID=330526 RepID=A0AAE0K2Y1_9PEZI|nr:hypothetical protein B0H63DRAFT_528830 [Podospora didyma]